MSTMTAISVRRIRSLLIKTISRHIWEEYLETSEDIRYTLGNKEIYMLREETIHTIYRQRPNENESRADLCVHESEKAGKDSGCKGKAGQKIRTLFYLL